MRKLYNSPMDPTADTNPDSTEVDPEELGLTEEELSPEVYIPRGTTLEIKEQELKVNTFFIVACWLITLAIAYYIPYYHAKSQVKRFDSIAQTAVKENLLLKEYKHKTQKLIQDVTYTEGVDNKVVDWVSRHTKEFIPRGVVVDIVAECSKYDTYLILLSIIKEKSYFDPFAEEENEAKGLAMIHTGLYGEELINDGVWGSNKDAFDYRKNIAALNHILTKLYKINPDWHTVFLGYADKDPQFAMKVLSNYGELSLVASR